MSLNVPHSLPSVLNYLDPGAKLFHQDWASLIRYILDSLLWTRFEKECFFPFVCILRTLYFLRCVWWWYWFLLECNFWCVNTVITTALVMFCTPHTNLKEKSTILVLFLWFQRSAAVFVFILHLFQRSLELRENIESLSTRRASEMQQHRR